MKHYARHLQTQIEGSRLWSTLFQTPHLTTLALFTPLIITAFVVGWNHTPSAWPNNIDPSVFMKRAGMMADTGQLITDGQVSPPLRYLPLAAIYWVLDPTPAVAGHLASLHAAVFSFVILPAAIYIFASTVYTRRVGAATIVGFILLRSLGFQSFGYYLGSWQYDIFAPFLFLGFAAAHNAITRDSKKWAVAAGVCTGMLGLGEFALTTVTVVIVSLAYFVNRDIDLLAVTGVTGVLFTPPLFMLPSKANNHVSIYLEKRIVPDGFSKWALSGMMRTPRDMAVFTGLILLAATAFVTATWLSDSRITEFSLGFYAVFWLTGNLTATWYHLGIVQKFGPFVLIAASVAVLSRQIDTSRRLPTLSRPQAALFWGFLMVAGTLLLVNSVPGYIGVNPMSGTLI
ncbi:hypothetical protein DMJ13_17570 [halophilic archaeon]|nr:hypothetical protein DMJ13_17570 [halophilic archaeon]